MSELGLCESCGMPLRNKEDFGGGRLDNKYCIHCTDAGGNLKPYDQALESVKQFIMDSMGVSEGDALKIAKENMARMPAWSKGGGS